MSGFFNGLKKGFKNFGENISVIINTALLTIAYILGIGITSLIAKIAGKKFLKIKYEPGSYWSGLNLGKKPTDEYYRQF